MLWNRLCGAAPGRRLSTSSRFLLLLDLWVSLPRCTLAPVSPTQGPSPLTVSPLQANSSDREQDSVLNLSSHVSSPESLSSKGDRAGKGADNLTPVLVNGKKVYFSKYLKACFTYPSRLSLSSYCPPDQLALLGDPFSWTQVPFVQRGRVPASISITLWNTKLFPTRFNIRTIKYLKIKGFFFPSPPPLSTLQSCSNSVSLHHWTLLFSFLPPYFSLFFLQLQHAALKIKIMPRSDSFAFTQHFP